jgi:hypothetical protein
LWLGGDDCDPFSGKFNARAGACSV